MANLAYTLIASLKSGLILKIFTGIRSGVLCSVLLAVWFSASLPLAYGQEKPGTKPIAVPLFRHVDPTRKDPDFKAYQVIRFSVTDDFPPFSYRTGNGALTGFNIAIANALCRIIRVECLFSVKPFAQANASIAKGEADAIITGLAESSATGRSLSFTRPYFRFTARFAVRQAQTITSNDQRALAGKRLGVIAGTQHATFLKDYFRRSKIRAFDNAGDAFEGLRTGAVDALFGDSLQLMFWLTSEKSKSCCKFVGDAYLDTATFSQPMAIAVGAKNTKLRALLDHALDRLQISGRYSKIFRQYFPLSPWKSNDVNKENPA